MADSDILSRKELKELEKAQQRLQEFAERQIALDSQHEQQIRARLEYQKQELQREAEINAVREKSISQVRSIIETKQKELDKDIQLKKHEWELLSAGEQKLELGREIGKLENQRVEYQLRINKLNEGELSSANKLLSLEKQRRQWLADMTKEKQKQADEDKRSYEDLLKRKALGEDISDDEISNAKQKAIKSQNKTDGFKMLANILENAIGMLSKFSSSLLQKIDSAINMYSDYKGFIDARLQTLTGTTAKTFDSINELYQSQLGTTGYLSYVDLMTNVDKLTKAGISYNIEERAFLETISDKMVASFSTLDSSLTRMIRIQQADMTRMLLGNEATLTQLFNEFFEDSSYLATNVSDSVAAALIDASSTMNVEDSSAFQFAAQKWLGALYEAGLSDSTAGSLAQAINLLGTGQASAFTNSPLSTLLNMAIARGDYSLSDVLIQGLNVDFIDDLMTSMITLLSDIKDNTSSQVTLAAYADVFGISMSDLRAFVNLKEDAITLRGYNQTAREAEAAVDDQISLLNERTTIAEKINNVINNLMYVTGENIADSNEQYVLYKLGTILQQLGQGTVLGLAGTLDTIGSIAYGLSEYGQNINSGDNKKWWQKAVDKVLESTGLGVITDIIDFARGFKDAIISPFKGFSSLSSMNVGNPYVRYERGAAYAGVMPEYGTVTQSLSSSKGLTIPGITNAMYGGITSSEGMYGLTMTAPGSDMSTYEKIASLSDAEGAIIRDVVSQETVEALSKSITLQDIYTEVFINQDYPIKVHLAYFDEQAMGQLKGDAHMDEDNAHLTALYTQATGLGINVQVDASDAAILAGQMYNVQLGG